MVETPIATSSTVKQQTWTKYSSNSLFWCAAVFLSILILLTLFAPLISPYRYDNIDLGQKNLPPSLTHWFGTDDLGRDLFTRIWYGARISLFVGITASIIDLFIGILWGGIAALNGGKIDDMMMRVVDILSSIPSLLVTICLITVVGTGLHAIIIALSIFGWITMARMVRAQFLLLKEQGYVLAARALGASPWRILFYHLLPNASGTIIVTLTLTVPSAIFSEAFLSYLGLGVQAPLASLGTMANEGLPAIEYYPWRLFIPAAFISLTILSFNILSDGLNDLLSSRCRSPN